jgi:hypothetical protein
MGTWDGLISNDFVRRFGMRKLLWIVLVGVVFMAGCTGKEGPMGPTGPQGEAGVALLREYSGTMTTADLDVLVPEILNLRQNTFVEVFRQLAGNTTLWEPVSDGYTNGTPPSARFMVSWSSGTVYLRDYSIGDGYLIKVYQNN